MKTLIVSIFIGLLSAVNVADDDTPIMLERDIDTGGARSVIVESVSASFNDAVMTISVYNYTGMVYIQLSDFDGVIINDAVFVNGESIIQEQISSLNSGNYFLKIRTVANYTGTLFK